MPIPAEDSLVDLTSEFSTWINLAASRAGLRSKKLVLVFDGVEKFEESAAQLNWLPQQCPEHFYLICTTTLESPQFGILRKRLPNTVQMIDPLAFDERSDYVNETLKNGMDAARVAKLVSPSSMGNPMRLSAVCREMDLFLNYSGDKTILDGDLDIKIDALMHAPSMTDLYAMILDRLEADFAEHFEAMQRILCSVALSRLGLSREEVFRIAKLAPEELTQVFTQIGSWFEAQDGVLSVENTMKQVIKKRFLSANDGFETSLHGELATFFTSQYKGSKRCVEAVWHLQFSGDDDKLCRELADPELLPFLFEEGEFKTEFLDLCRKVGGGKYTDVMEKMTENLNSSTGGVSEMTRWGRKHLVAQFGREAGMYQQATALLVDLIEPIPLGITANQVVGVLLLLQEMHWRYRVASPNEGEKVQEAAVRLLKQALDMMQGIEDKNLLSQVYHGLGLVNLIFFRKLAVDDVKIQKYLEQALELRLETGDYAAAGDTLNGLGSLAQKQKKLKRAEMQFMKSLELREKVLGSYSPDIAQVNTSLGSLYSDMKDWKKAKRWYVRAKDIYAKTLGEKHPRGATALEGLGKVYKEMGDLASAKSVLEKVALIHEAKGPEDAGFKRIGALLTDIALLNSQKRDAVVKHVAQDQGRVVRPFLSSTFDDMGAEREILTEQIFPAIQQNLLKRRIQFQPRDLRWGVTKEEGTGGMVSKGARVRVRVGVSIGRGSKEQGSEDGRGLNPEFESPCPSDCLPSDILPWRLVVQ